jgi:hypothetical protein
MKSVWKMPQTSASEWAKWGHWTVASGENRSLYPWGENVFKSEVFASIFFIHFIKFIVLILFSTFS